MKSLICVKPGEFAMVETKEPLENAGHSILRLERLGICGTDYHAFGGNQPFFNYPRILGHEIAGRIEQTGSELFKVGDRVTVSPYIYCGKCIACRNSKTNCCVSMNVIGVHSDGGMQEYISVPNHLLIHGNGLEPDQLALVEPLAIGAHGVAKANVLPGENVLIIGAGPIGLATADFVRIAGGRVIIMDVAIEKLEFCRKIMGFIDTVHAVSEDTYLQLSVLTNGEMPTAIFDCTGNLQAIECGFTYLAHSARYVMIGLQKQEISFNHPEFHKREATLMSSRNALPKDFEHVINSIKNGDIQTENYITHRIDFEDVKEQFSSLRQPGETVVKALIHFS
ncbi:2-desacetyl-2-hydroxyethyl bacteriochlorophyllide A dehydrogenase [Pedobacter sp. CAN_A7]|uniref:zinc-binding alcohol dehydrogenase family protein n=1 Tax=Pedobacter sp. CAN_A7 TaxID=2787722 RepID=UPI0018CA363C